MTDYGADPTGTHDSTAAILAAQAAATALTFYGPAGGLNQPGGVVVFFPPGVYIVQGTIPYVSGVTFLGVGWGSEILFEPTGSTDLALFSPSTTTADGHNVVNVRWSNLMIWGWAAHAQDGIVIGPSMFCDVDHCIVAGFNRYGVGFVTPSAGQANYYHRLNQCLLYDNGINLSIPQGVNAVYVSGGDIRYAGSLWVGRQPAAGPGVLYRDGRPGRHFQRRHD